MPSHPENIWDIMKSKRKSISIRLHVISIQCRSMWRPVIGIMFFVVKKDIAFMLALLVGIASDGSFVSYL